MQKWEYQTFLRSRKWGGGSGLRGSYDIGTEWNVDLKQALEELGEMGWELVAVSPRSSYTGNDTDIAGFTSDELWIFKRPKQ